MAVSKSSRSPSCSQTGFVYTLQLACLCLYFLFSQWPLSSSTSFKVNRFQRPHTPVALSTRSCTIIRTRRWWAGKEGTIEVRIACGLPKWRLEVKNSGYLPRFYDSLLKSIKSLTLWPLPFYTYPTHWRRWSLQLVCSMSYSLGFLTVHALLTKKKYIKGTLLKNFSSESLLPFLGTWRGLDNQEESWKSSYLGATLFYVYFGRIRKGDPARRCTYRHVAWWVEPRPDFDPAD